MKTHILMPTALAVSIVAAGVLSTVLAAQEPQAAPPAAAPRGGPGGQPRNFPKPTNLKVLSKDLTGAQVRDVMRKWEGDLGGECSSCHDEYDDHRKNERGQPQLDFAKDGKPEKEMARIMYTMTESLKKDEIQKVKDLDKEMKEPKAELTCGTCHRGKENPEAFVPPKREGGPGGGMQRPPAGN